MTKEQRSMSQDTGSMSPQSFHKDIAYSDIQLGDAVGSGAFGIVHKAMWNGLQVAVKVMEGDDATKALQKEVHQLSKLRHENIIRLYGVCHHRPKVCLVMEYAENGSLYDLLHPRDQDTKLCEYTIGHVMSWALQCARAMEYLHGLAPTPIVHRDLKPPNMLLKEHGTILKICDFGTARPQDTSHMTSSKGSAAWMAPEVFEGNSYSEKCDVFSFGIALWEMITRRKPFDDIGAPPFRIMWAVHRGNRPPLIRGIPKVFEHLMICAWDKNTKIRPPFSAIVLFLEKASKFVSGCNTPLKIPTIPDTTDNEYSSGSGSFCDTPKEQYSSEGSAGKVSITGKDKVQYKVSSPERGHSLNETDESVVSPFPKNENLTAASSPSPTRKSPAPHTRIYDEERPLEGPKEVPTTQLKTPPNQQVIDSPIASPNYLPYSPSYEGTIDSNDSTVVQKMSSNTYGHDYKNPNGSWMQGPGYLDEGIRPPKYNFVFQGRPVHHPPSYRSPNPDTSPEMYSPFPAPFPYAQPQGLPGHGLRTPVPRNASDMFHPGPWNGRLFPSPIPEHGAMANLETTRMNPTDSPDNDGMIAQNANLPNYPVGKTSGSELSSSGSMWPFGGTSSPLGIDMLNPNTPDINMGNKSPRSSRFPDRSHVHRHPRPATQSAIDIREEENLWHLIESEIMPLRPIQDNRESMEIYQQHSMLISEYTNLQKNIDRFVQRKHELQKQLDAEINEQKRNSMYLEQYLKLLEEKQSLSAFLNTLKQEIQQEFQKANSFRGVCENLL